MKISSLIHALRLHQWPKNLLIAAAPFAAGQILNYWREIIIALIAFGFASSFGYLVNDFIDKESDQNHNVKKFRPFASGELSEKQMYMLMLFCIICFIIPLLLLNVLFNVAIFAYIVISISYSCFFKNIPVLEFFWLASGFLIRALAGSALINQPPTIWFIVTLYFASLYLILNKRLSELSYKQSKRYRIVLNYYSSSLLIVFLWISGATILLTYIMWIFSVHPDSMIAQISIFSLLYSILVYRFRQTSNSLEFPEKAAFSNRFFLLGIVLTIFLLTLVIYE